MGADIVTEALSVAEGLFGEFYVIFAVAVGVLAFGFIVTVILRARG